MRRTAMDSEEPKAGARGGTGDDHVPPESAPNAGVVPSLIQLHHTS